MANITNDLDRFLKTDGVRILEESGALHPDFGDPLTMEDIDDFSSMNLENLTADDLEDLIMKVTDVLDELTRNGPAAETDELRNYRISETRAFRDRILRQLDVLEGIEE